MPLVILLTIGHWPHYWKSKGVIFELIIALILIVVVFGYAIVNNQLINADYLEIEYCYYISYFTIFG